MKSETTTPWLQPMLDDMKEDRKTTLTETTSPWGDPDSSGGEQDPPLSQASRYVRRLRKNPRYKDTSLVPLPPHADKSTGEAEGEKLQRLYPQKGSPMVPIWEMRGWTAPPPPPNDNSTMARLYRKEHHVPQSEGRNGIHRQGTGNHPQGAIGHPLKDGIQPRAPMTELPIHEKRLKYGLEPNPSQFLVPIQPPQLFPNDPFLNFTRHICADYHAQQYHSSPSAYSSISTETPLTEPQALASESLRVLQNAFSGKQ